MVLSNFMFGGEESKGQNSYESAPYWGYAQELMSEVAALGPQQAAFIIRTPKNECLYCCLNIKTELELYEGGSQGVFVLVHCSL